MAGNRWISPLVICLCLCTAVALQDTDGNDILDLSYEFGPNTLYWPSLGPFVQTFYRGPLGNIPWYESNTFAAPEHGGTHLDAPAHLAKGKQRVDEIPINKLVNQRAIRVDISSQARNDSDYLLTVKDLEDWEVVNGLINDGVLLFVYTGWGAFYPNRLAYFGSARNDTYLDDEGNSLLHFPGVSAAAATWLVSNRKITGIGIDTPSIDFGPSVEFEAHQIFLAENIYGMECVANLDKLPTTGSRVSALPMKIDGGSGGPLRLFASLETESNTCAAPATALKDQTVLLASFILSVCLILM